MSEASDRRKADIVDACIEQWTACWDAIADAAWPAGGATRAEVLDMLLGRNVDPR